METKDTKLRGAGLFFGFKENISDGRVAHNVFVE